MEKDKSLDQNENNVVEGNKKLKLSITRMKKLRTGAQGGLSESGNHATSGASHTPWG